MIDIESYVGKLTELIKAEFGERLAYIGLQGSYFREEADENSDIDIMVIIEDLSASDLENYKKIIDKAGYAEKACGFICGKAEMKNWNPCEICQLVHTTKDLYGSLSELVPDYTDEDERVYIKICLDNLYHELCHSYIHGSEEMNNKRLQFLYKTIFFLLQNIHYLNTGNFVQTKNELILQLSGQDRTVISLTSDSNQKFSDMFSTLFEWCRDKICTI